MQDTNTTTHRRTTCLVIATLLTATCAQAATTFVTTPTGNAADLNGVGANDVTALTLSPEDGGGTITLSTISVFEGSNAASLSMDADSMGVGNDKWGTAQSWTFTFDQTINFDALGFFADGGETMNLASAAWKDDAATTGTNWSFTSDGTVGTFSFNSATLPDRDFTSGNFSSVTAGTAITLEHVAGNGGAQMSSFTISPAAIPEPSTFALLGGVAALLLLRRRRN